ncbi:hypothetical protein BDFB_009771 [Asbolus verrucosus]|uniref:Uncharacterized protein n=1 Tax=Asbolus verrucosus TaxID=1661398 RepID=A0A482W3H1_ASBVE|nr:hypothetical protein BDFB_009771 [Asbolus verrucosus]
MMNVLGKFRDWIKTKKVNVAREEVMVVYFKGMIGKFAPPSLWFIESSDIEESAILAVEYLLPVKSEDKYENAYWQFDDWCKEKRVKEEVSLAYF